MTTAISKRNQARNEKALQDLIRNVPGNDRCADCSARNPGWASWSLGIFLCMRCAAIHRKLGTHISKVKSLSMDSWSNDQVDNMRKVGNVNSNKIWNPQNKQPIVPIDVDEVDGAVERFIRQKYEHKAFVGGKVPAPMQIPQHTSNSGSAVVSPTPQSPNFSREGSPPPSAQPAKSGKRFGFGLRSATSTFHLGKPKGRERKASLPTGRVVGATIGIKEDELGWKLVTLKDMGFQDEKRNTEILKGLNGDLERTIESLVRLGQGPPNDVSLKKKVSTKFESDPDRFPQPPERTSSKPVAQPFGITGASVQQSPQTTGTIQSSASSPGATRSAHNPFNGTAQFGQPQLQQSQGAFEQAFNNMTISQPMSSQSTGILPSQQPVQQTVYQQSMTPPPMGGMQQQSPYNPYIQQQQTSQQGNNWAQTGGYPPMQPVQSLQPQMTGNNPFLQNQMQPQSFQSTSNPFVQMQPQVTGNPFLQQANTGAFTSNPQMQQPQQVQYMDPNQNMAQSPASYQNPSFPIQQQPQNLGQQNPFHQQTQQQMQQQQIQLQMQQQQQQQQQQLPQQQQFVPQQFQQPQMQPIMAQPTGRLNKQNIMALYNHPQMAPQPSIPEHPEQQQQQQQQQIAQNPASPTNGQMAQVPGNAAGNRRSVTMPAAMSTGSNNPFGAVTPQGQTTPGARVRDSIFMDGATDPFASLSAKFVR